MEYRLIGLVFPIIKYIDTGRRIASSNIYGRLVAPTKNTFFFGPIPSIYVNNWFITLSPAPPASPIEFPLDTAIESS